MSVNTRALLIGEALFELEVIFNTPGAFGSQSVLEATETLASEFIGPYADQELTKRLEEFQAAEKGGDLPGARRHLNALKKKLEKSYAIVPAPGEGDGKPTPLYTRKSPGGKKARSPRMAAKVGGS